MILGAGVYQVPLIRKAAGMGLETVVVSPPGRYPGIPLADIVLGLDTTDIPRIVSAAADYAVAGIATTGTDVCVSTVGAVADALGLNGPSRELADTVSSKTAFRAFQRQHHLPCPDFAVCRSGNEAVMFYRALKADAVIKPDDSSGSRGVTVLHAGQPDSAVDAAYQEAIRHSRNGLVCAEAFIEGREVGGDAFLVDGTLAFLTITSKHMRGVLVLGHSLPGTLSLSDSRGVRDAIIQAAERLGYRDGPLNFDVIIGQGGATILEMGLRNGGNGILDLVYHAEGVDLLEWVLAYALGHPIPARQPCPACAVSSYVFGSDRAGRLTAVSGLETLQAGVPEVFKMILAKSPGDDVVPFTHNANLVGYLLVRCGASSYRDVGLKIRQTLKVEVEPWTK